jgi:very-short-patch-repair endonuclease
MWLIACVEKCHHNVSEIGAFDGKRHNEIIDKFAYLDDEAIKCAARRVQRTHAEWLREVRDAYPEQDVRLGREIEKSKRQMPLRKALSLTNDVLLTICPCWMASPLNVSQYIEGAQPYFDYIIFDEASQMTIEDAVCSIARGKQIIVAGDEHQLPPTPFFNVGGDDDDDYDEVEDTTEGLESILSAVKTILPPKPLLMHYRSHDERLIAFSNDFIYKRFNQSLITFPSTSIEPPLSFTKVDDELHGVYDTSGSPAQVKEVVETVFRHWEQSPNSSLGVITCGIYHRDRIMMAIDNEISQRKEFEHMIDPQLPEKFFVKSIENVQGDERDAIIFSVGYGRGPDGRISYKWGPIDKQGGERRLNVAVTRARQHMTVISSFSHTDLDPAKTAQAGKEFLRGYLEFVADPNRGILSSNRLYEDVTKMNDFECDVSVHLTNAGMQILPQWGVSSYRLDFAVQHPDEPGRFILAIECDGASYHSAKMARERDKLRQRILEKLGWRFCRIWSTDWFNDRESEVKRVLGAYENALAHSIAPNVSKVILHPTKITPARYQKPKIRSNVDFWHRYQSEITLLIDWIKSDGVPWTSQEILNELRKELGIARLGNRIKERLEIYIKEAGRDALPPETCPSNPFHI